MGRRGNIELRIPWEDGATVEIRYFHSIAAARGYAERNGLPDSDILDTGSSRRKQNRQRRNRRTDMRF